MARDRLAELKQVQNRPQNKNGQVSIDVDNNSNSSTDNATKQETKKLRQTFERSEVIGQWIGQMEENLKQIRLHIRKIQEMKFDQRGVHDKLNDLFQNNTSIAQQTSHKLKEVTEELSTTNLNSAEGRIKNIQHTTLKTRFQEVFLQNNSELENYRDLQKQMIKAQLCAKGNIQVTDEELTALLDEGQDLQVFTENILAETAEAKRILADVTERHQHLIQIERMLTEVRDLFLHMSILIDNQQELIDRIEYQAQSATEYIGAVDLNKVRKSKRKYMKRKIYITLALVTLVIIIVILIVKS